ncbi:MAG TPA: alpha/beta hydrolase [Tepidisphaeraceae bacterium]|jgi:pimeloyl-ACP methyl ester carboxylesterase|nr:alpha/beta hydrolase [Tepidisphaeraceae bacterium]
MAPLSLVLLPGMDGTGLLFQPLIAALPDSLAPVVVRYPGDCCLSYKDLLPIALAALPRDGGFVLLGESFSGPLTVMIASIRPAGLAGVILCASFVSKPRRFLGPAVHLFVRAPLFGCYFPYKRLCARLLGLTEPAHRRMLDEMDRMVKPAVIAHRVRMVFQTDVRDALRSCQVPMLYIQAKKDLLVPRRNLRQIQRIKPDIEVVTLDSSHFVLQSHPASAAPAIAKFALNAPPAPCVSDSLFGGTAPRP